MYHRWLVVFILLSGAGAFVAALSLYLQGMPSHGVSTDVSEVSELPFLSDSVTTQYVISSKLIVLVGSSEEIIFRNIADIYGTNATCLSGGDASELLAKVQAVCAADKHLIAVSSGKLTSKEILPFAQIAWKYNYIVALMNEPETVLPQYVGWHLNEADSCMLGLCAHALLEDLLKTVSEFYSDFRDFSESETIPEMLKYYQLASSNHNGMLHCTAKYFGDEPTKPNKKYFKRVNSNITQRFESTVIGLVFTKRTFGARLKLSAEQLDLWGGDDVGTTNALRSGLKRRPYENDSMSSLQTAMAQHSIHGASENEPIPHSCNKKSNRYFPNCQASLLYLTEHASDEPDFHPVSGPGRKAHMTLGVAPKESAVTTGTDLLEVVALEALEKKWPTYNCSRGWLRNYGEGRWVLYMNNKITVGSLFAGVYVPS